MMDTPSSMQPLFPEPGPLEELGLSVLREASALGGQLHPHSRRSVADLLRTINTYHSNLIEGHDTRPLDIARALAGRFSTDPERRGLQLEARAHVEVQKRVEERLEGEAVPAITSVEFLSFLHREFYERMPPSLRIVRSADGTRQQDVLPGRLREEDLEVGRHVPPPAKSLPGFLEAFHAGYDPDRLGGLERLLATAASHHRLLWIHPFLDGNGRVGRLFTDAYLRRAGLGGHGLWTASRGLARQRSRYLDALAAADAERWNDYDGRGARSRRALTAFARFFLEVCLDQIRFMGALLDLDGLRARIEDYALRRRRGALGTKLSAEARHLLVGALLGGSVARGEAPRMAGVSDRSARRILSQLVREGLLVSDTPKGPVRLGFPVSVVGFYFPHLLPEEALGAEIRAGTS